MGWVSPDACAHGRFAAAPSKMESLEEKSVEDICDWLEEKGFSDQLIENFRGKHLHGVG